MANFRKIKEEIRTLSNSYILAVSGGIDSVFLADFFNNCKTKCVIAHFNHKLREESTQEEELVRSIAAKYQMPFELGFGENIHTASSIENEARTQRYAFLRDIKEKYHAGYIVTGHHLNDQMETILLNLTRGRDHSKLAMQRIGTDLYRPFLEIEKNELIKCATSRNLIWMEDASNNQQDYERNWIRHTVLPLLHTKRNVTKTLVKGIGK